MGAVINILNTDKDNIQYPDVVSISRFFIIKSGIAPKVAWTVALGHNENIMKNFSLKKNEEFIKHKNTDRLLTRRPKKIISKPIFPAKIIIFI